MRLPSSPRMTGGIGQAPQDHCKKWPKRLAGRMLSTRGSRVRITRTVRDGSTQDWWALEIVAGPDGPDKTERAGGATTGPQTVPDPPTQYLRTDLRGPPSV